jgi:threonine/homoserine/homoserine lactone efflux protein
MELDARFGAFVLLSVLIIVTPGPDTALIIRNALSSGPRASSVSATGVAVGIMAWATAAALGVGALLEQSSIAFTFLKLAGAAYLCYLGVRSLLSSRQSKETDAALPPSGGGPAWSRSEHAGVGGVNHHGLSDRQAFSQGLFSNLLNPKTGAFFVTVMPQFLVPGDASLRLVAMVAAFEAILLVWLIAYGHAVSRAGRSRFGSRVRLALERLSGLVLIGLGARLALERR